MTCNICKKKLAPEHLLVPLVKLVRNEHRGDFMADTGEYVHLSCLVEGKQS